MKFLIKKIYYFFCRILTLIPFFLFGGKLSKGSFFKWKFTLRGIKHMEIGIGSVMDKNSKIICIEKYAGDIFRPILHIGNGVYINRYCYIACGCEIYIGDNTAIGNYFFCTDINHGFDDLNEPIINQKLNTKPVKIGENCWLGNNVTVLPGVNIGSHCIIGASSVVTKNVPSYSIVAGNPARVIKKYNFTTKSWEKI